MPKSLKILQKAITLLQAIPYVICEGIACKARCACVSAGYITYARAREREKIKNYLQAKIGNSLIGL